MLTVMNPQRGMCMKGSGLMPVVLPAVLAVLVLAGCIARQEQGAKIRDLEFTVLDEADVPEELAVLIREEKEKAFRLTYEDQGELYIAEGYGRQPETGYSVRVDALYETEEAVCIHTTLLGPAAGEETREIPVFPYVTVRLESVGKEVRFGQTVRESARKTVRGTAQESARKTVRGPTQESVRGPVRESVRETVRQTLPESVRQPGEGAEHEETGKKSGGIVWS